MSGKISAKNAISDPNKGEVFREILLKKLSEVF